MNDSEIVPYDQLLLCTGQQYHLAVPTDADVEELVTTSEALQKKIPSVNIVVYCVTSFNFFFHSGSFDLLQFYVLIFTLFFISNT